VFHRRSKPRIALQLVKASLGRTKTQHQKGNVEFDVSSSDFGLCSLTALGPVVRRPVNANNLGLKFNQGYRFPYSKEFSQQIPGGSKSSLKATKAKIINRKPYTCDPVQFFAPCKVIRNPESRKF